MELDTTSAEMKKGLLIVAVLQLLSGRKMYTAELLEHLSKTEFATQEGTLYPLLSRLKRQGLIDHEWIESKSGPPRKYCQLSKDGDIYRRSLITYLETLKYQLVSLKGENSI